MYADDKILFARYISAAADKLIPLVTKLIGFIATGETEAENRKCGDVDVQAHDIILDGTA